MPLFASFRKGLSFKMIVWIFSSVAIICMAIYFYNYSISRSLISKNLRENSELLTSETVLEVEKILAGVQKIPDNLAKVIASKDYSAEDLEKLIALIVSSNQDIFGIAVAFEPYAIGGDSVQFCPYVFKTDGNKVSTRLLGGEYDFYTKDWYQIPKELDRPVWSEPYYDQGGGNVVMSTYSAPMYRTVNGEKKFIGIVTADISLSWLHNIIAKIKVYETGYAFVVSKTGTIVTHPIPEKIMNETIFSIAEEQSSPQLREIGRSMIKGESSFAELEYKNVRTGKLSWISYAPITLNGWSLGIVYPVEEFEADLNSLFLTMMVFGTMGAIVLLIVIVFISRSITKPLRQLAGATKAFAAGSYDVTLPDIDSEDEISNLNNSFKVMQGALADTIGKLKDANDSLEEYSQSLEEKVDLRTAQLKQKNVELDAALGNVRSLNEIGKKITSTLNYDSIFTTVYEEVNRLLDAPVFLILFYNREESRLDCKLSIEKGERLPLYSYSMSEKNRFATWCVDNKAPVIIGDVDTEYSKYIKERSKPKAGDYVSSIIYFPLIIEDRVIGAMSVQSFKKNAYSSANIDFLSNLANYTAIALDNADAYETINKSHKDLQDAQNQLIQAEKMASLGQLTAGIAHEIKNPLNFVNNFSELSAELVKELLEELNAHEEKFDPKTIEYLREILGDLEHNVVKIHEHGKRADSIVKGMLLHSRGKSGEMQKTNLNDLLAEYVNLAYHGFRALDSSFNIKIVTNYDTAIPQVNVVPQNISRVFLNTINNACYAVNEKKKERGDKFSPVLTVSTKDLPNAIEVKIRDNGKGISEENRNKIFNPFFTTKPTGKGTGLGLSLSYDIVVQEHKGEISVDSVEGEYAEFTITIPKNL